MPDYLRIERRSATPPVRPANVQRKRVEEVVRRLASGSADGQGTFPRCQARPHEPRNPLTHLYLPRWGKRPRSYSMTTAVPLTLTISMLLPWPDPIVS